MTNNFLTLITLFFKINVGYKYKPNIRKNQKFFVILHFTIAPLKLF